jgi:hypothetical protein
MSYPQAFHTSCRNGLSGHAGFQFNAASPGFDDRQLSALAAAHAGYRAAPDAPAEPDAAEIERLPVALRYLPVQGLGDVVSRTASFAAATASPTAAASATTSPTSSSAPARGGTASTG